MLLEMILFSGFAGVTVIIGGLLANYFNHHIKETPVKYEIIHTLMSFGSGIMLSAIGSNCYFVFSRSFNFYVY